MILEIISPDACLFTGEVVSVSFPGTEGRFEVCTGHAPLIAALKAGEIRYVALTGETTGTLSIAGGFAEVRNGRITACVEQEPAEIPEEK